MIRRAYFYRGEIKSTKATFSGTVEFKSWLPNPMAAYEHVQEVIVRESRCTADAICFTEFKRI